MRLFSNRNIESTEIHGDTQWILGKDFRNCPIREDLGISIVVVCQIKAKEQVALPREIMKRRDSSPRHCPCFCTLKILQHTGRATVARWSALLFESQNISFLPYHKEFHGFRFWSVSPALCESKLFGIYYLKFLKWSQLGKMITQKGATLA